MNNYDIYYIGSTNDIELNELHNEAVGLYENDATVTVTITHLDGTPVSGASWPLTFEHVPGSNGDYNLYLPELDLKPGDRCVGIISASSSTGYSKRWDLRIIALLDHEDDE